MSLWVPEKLGEKAKEDAENDKYNPPHRWRRSPRRYDRAFNLHHSDKDGY